MSNKFPLKSNTTKVCKFYLLESHSAEELANKLMRKTRTMIPHLDTYTLWLHTSVITMHNVIWHSSEKGNTVIIPEHKQLGLESGDLPSLCPRLHRRCILWHSVQRSTITCYYLLELVLHWQQMNWRRYKILNIYVYSPTFAIIRLRVSNTYFLNLPISSRSTKDHSKFGLGLP